MAATRTTCPYCGVGCGVSATPDGAGGAAIAGDGDHPANRGRLCSKGTALGDTLGLDGRLLHPMIGRERASWDDATRAIARAFGETIAQHGPDSVALYVSGQLLTEDYYAANKLAKGFLGTANIDSNSRLCMASSVAGHVRAFGEDLVPGIYEDLELADLVVLVGSNTAWCHPVLFQRMVAARAARPGTRLVVVDPRRTATCEGADLHLPLRPGTDVALFNGLLAHLASADDTRPAVVAARQDAPDAATTAALCGLDVADVDRFFAWFAATERTVTMFSQGVNQSSAGTDKVNAIINVHALTGRVGRPGSGPFSVTGQPNAMGGREVGALATTLAAHLSWTRPDDAALLRGFWGAPSVPSARGLTAGELAGAIEDGRIRALWVLGTNPAVSLPEAARVRAALAACPFLAVSETEASTDTAVLAHVRLPALGWGEKDGTVTNSERVISRQRAFLPAPGEARADWRALAAVAGHLGHGAAFAWRGSAEIFREHAALSGHGNTGARVFDISGLAGLTDAGYDAMEPTRWPCPAAGPRAERLCADGRTRLVPTPFRPPATVVSAEYPLALLTGRLRDQWHTMTRTGRSARLMAHAPEPVLSAHPDDVAGLAGGGLEDGGLVRVETESGSAVLRLRLDPAMRRGDVFVPMHWTDQFCAAGGINPAVLGTPDPVSFQPELKHTRARLAPHPADWHGFVLARTRLGADLAPWCAVLPTLAGAWRHEVAGDGDPRAAWLALRERFGGDGAWLALQDDAAGVWRAALVRDGALLGAAFFARRATDLPAREWLVGLFAQDRLALNERRALLAARPADGPAPEPAICVCHGVGASAIGAAVAAGAASVEAIGAATRAGTNCGSCRPELAALLAAARLPVAAE